MLNASARRSASECFHFRTKLILSFRPFLSHKNFTLIT